MPCPDCGESLDPAGREAHWCDNDRWTTYQLFQRRDELARLDEQIAAYLDSPRGRFELWYAARSRR